MNAVDPATGNLLVDGRVERREADAAGVRPQEPERDAVRFALA